MAQDNQVVIEIVADTSKLNQQVETMQQNIVKAANTSTEAFEQFNTANKEVTASAQKTTATIQDMNKVIGNGATKQYAQDLENVVATLYDEGKVMEALITKYGTAQGALKAMQKELGTMAALGQRSTAEFKQLAKTTAELQDRIQDTRGEIKKMASDTKVFDTLVQGARGFTAAMNVAVGATALFGDENKDLQKELLKVQGAMAALQGVQELANIATEKGGILTQGYGLALKAVTAIEETFAVSTAAAWAAVTGGVTLAIGAIAGLIAYFNTGNDKADEIFEAQKKRQEEEAKEQLRLKEEQLKQISDADKKYFDEVERERKERLANGQKEAEVEFDLLTRNIEKFQNKIKAYKSGDYSYLGLSVEEEKDRLDKLNDYVNEALIKRNKILAVADEKSKKDAKKFVRKAVEEIQLDLQQQVGAVIADEAMLKAFTDAVKEFKIPQEEIIQILAEKFGFTPKQISDYLEKLYQKEPIEIKLDKIKITGKTLPEQLKDEAKLKADNDKAIADFSIATAKQTTDTIFSIENAARQAQFDSDIKHLEERKNKELDNEKLTKGQIDAINKKYAREEAALKLKQWKAEKDAKLEQAIINGALAITNILATMNWSTFGVAQALAIAGAVASTAAQVAVIASAQPPAFAKGIEYVPLGSNREGIDTVPAYLTKGERVVPVDINEQLKGIPNERLPELVRMAEAALYTPMPHAPELKGMNAVIVKNEIDYKKLARAFSEELKANPQTHFTIDKNGFSVHLLDKQNKVTRLNNRYES